MATKCTICNHDRIKEINRLLLAGRTCAEIGRKFSISSSTLGNHKRNHIHKAILADTEAHQQVSKALSRVGAEVADGAIDKLCAQDLMFIREQCFICYQGSMMNNNFQEATKALREGRKTIETIIKTMHLFESKKEKQDWEVIITTIMSALEDFPEAKIKVSDYLEGILNEEKDKK